MQLKHLLMASALVYGTQAIAQPATASRLIATATSEHNNAVFVLKDSSYMTYTNDRGGDLEHDMKFDRRTNMLFNTGTGSYRPNSRVTQTYDANSHVLTSLDESYNLPSSSWVNLTNSIYTYNDMQNMETHIMQIWNGSLGEWENYNKMLYFYNGDNTLDTTISQIWDPSINSWNNTSMTITNYDINGDLLVETTFDWDGFSSWSNASKKFYTYANGNLEAETNQTWDLFTNAWISNSRIQYTYDGMKNMLTTIGMSWGSSSTWVNNYKITNAYSSRNDLESTLMQDWDLSANNWKNNSMNVFTNDTNHNNTIEVVQSWIPSVNLFRNAFKFQRNYNSRGQMTVEMQQRWNIGGFWENLAGDSYNRYYYQTYTLGIADAGKSENNIKVYPVPAAQIINVEMSFNQPQAFTVSLTDATGRIVRQWAEVATEKYHRAVPVSEIPAGNYFLKIQGQTERSVTQIMIAH